jgi:hypothetical protein
MMPSQLTTTYEGIWYTHRLLWQIAEKQAALARGRDREWVNYSLVAVTFAFHALEAYINLAGEHLDPVLWADERNNFRGWTPKLRKVLELTNIPWEPATRPIRTVLELKELRDALARGRAERSAGTVDHNGDPYKAAPLPNLSIRALVLPKERFDVVLGDVRALIDKTHSEVAARASDEFSKMGPLDGTTFWMTRQTTLKK